MQKLEAKIGYTFQNQELLTTALTHSSYTREFGRDDIRELIVEGTTRIFYRVHDGCCDILSVRRARELLGSLRAL